MKTVSIGGEEFRIQEAVVVIGADGNPLAPGSLSGDASAANQATGNTKLDEIKTKLDTLNTAVGAKTDAAWDGVAASASVISLLKAIAVNTTPAP
jgi:hypothetical protein